MSAIPPDNMPPKIKEVFDSLKANRLAMEEMPPATIGDKRAHDLRIKELDVKHAESVERIREQEARKAEAEVEKERIKALRAGIALDGDLPTDFSKPYPLSPTISVDEWDNAHAAPICIVDGWFYEDVGVFIAPGGTGKTTFVLFEAIHIALGKPLFGSRVFNPGPVVILTAEDTREMLIARLRHISCQLPLTEDEMQRVRDSIVITDVAGTGFKLTEVMRDVVRPAAIVDTLIASLRRITPAIVFIDPAVSFGVGESRVNDAEQGLIDAGRKIRNEVQCGVIYVHHTGKESARKGSIDQYAGRGGSAFADGSRMVHVLQRMEPDKWFEATGDELKPNEVGLILARPKISAEPPQADLYIKRRGYLFERYDHTASANALLDANANKVWAILREQTDAGYFPTQNSIEALTREQKISRAPLREAIAHLRSTGRVIETSMTTGGQGGARKYLRPVEAQPPAPTA